MLLNHTDLGPRSGWVTLNKSLYLLWGFSFLTCETGPIVSHRTGVRICDKVKVQNACHAAGSGQMAALMTSIITVGLLEALSLKLPFSAHSCPSVQLTPLGCDFNSLSCKPSWINDTRTGRSGLMARISHLLCDLGQQPYSLWRV